MSSTTSTDTTSAVLTGFNPRRLGPFRTMRAVIRALGTRAGTSMSAAPRPAPSNRWVGPVTRDYALDPAYHLRMVR